MPLNCFAPKTHTAAHTSKQHFAMSQKNFIEQLFTFSRKLVNDNPFIKQAYQTMVTLRQKAFATSEFHLHQRPK